MPIDWKARKPPPPEPTAPQPSVDWTVTHTDTNLAKLEIVQNTRAADKLLATFTGRHDMQPSDTITYHGLKFYITQLTHSMHGAVFITEVEAQAPMLTESKTTKTRRMV